MTTEPIPESQRPLGLHHVLDLLGYEPTERFQLARKTPGTPYLTATVHAPEYAVELYGRPAGGDDQWFGVNPVALTPTGRQRKERYGEGIAESWDEARGRPDSTDITRVAGLAADLDVKPGGCPSYDVAELIIADLSAMLGDRPVAITRSGHGLQPIWAVEDGHIAAETASDDRSVMRALLRRWGRLVAAVAERRGARVDTIFDLPRILRLPNSVNHKAAPISVVTVPGFGAPVSIERVLETLDEGGIEDRPEDHDDPGALVSPPAEWVWGRTTCGYAELTMRGWASDRPDRDRHGWLVNQGTRIAAMHRKGCLTASDHRRAVELAVNRFRQLLAIPTVDSKPREPERGEISDALAWGQSRAASFTDARLDEEVGGHAHKPLLAAPTGPGPGKSTVAGPTMPAPQSERTTNAAVRDLPGRVHEDLARPGILDGPRDGNEGQLPTPGATGPASVGVARSTLRELIREAEASESAPDLPAPEPETPEQAEFRLQVEQQALRMWIADEARRIEQQRKAGAIEVPAPTSGAAFLALPDDPARYRIAGLLPVGGRVVVSAQFKSGKSVMMGNLLRSLVDGDPFLGQFEVSRVDGSVVLVDDELDERTLRRWLREQGIRDVERFEVVPLRGRVATFDLTNDVIRAEWAHNLRKANCAFLIFDCLRPVLDAIGLSEDKESGHFLVALDALARDAGIAEMAVVHHMGHSSERARGDSRLRDWPDAEWKIIRDSGAEDDPSAPRYFSAFGRDVDIKEGALTLQGRRLTFTPGEARKRGHRGSEPGRIAVEPAIEDVLRHAADPISKRQLEMALTAEGHAVHPIREAMTRLIDAGLIKVRPQGRSLLCEWSEGAQQHAG